jgi:hypothetical protein
MEVWAKQSWTIKFAQAELQETLKNQVNVLYLQPATKLIKRLIKSVILAVEYRIKMQPIAKLIQKQQTLHQLSVLQGDLNQLTSIFTIKTR